LHNIVESQSEIRLQSWIRALDSEPIDFERTGDAISKPTRQLTNESAAAATAVKIAELKRMGFPWIYEQEEIAIASSFGSIS
jgi:hypothetical protein